MKISEKQGGDFTPHDEGTYKGVCVDVTPLEKQHSEFGERDVFRLVFETDAPERNGRRQCVWSRNFTPSLNEKANFRKFLRQWRGRDITAGEATEFDTEALLGMHCNLVVVHEEGKKEGQVFANIAACTPCKDDPIEAAGGFTRKQDRVANQSGDGGEGAGYRKAAEPTGGTAKGEAIDQTQAGGDWTKVKVHVGNHAGVEVRDLDPVAIGKLVEKWLPAHNANAKQSADDKRLAAALTKAQAELAGATSDY